MKWKHTPVVGTILLMLALVGLLAVFVYSTIEKGGENSPVASPGQLLDEVTGSICMKEQISDRLKFGVLPITVDQVKWYKAQCQHPHQQIDPTPEEIRALNFQKNIVLKAMEK